MGKGLIYPCGQGQDVSQSKHFGRKVWEAEQRGEQAIGRYMLNLIVKFLTNGGAEDRMHVLVELLVEVAIIVEVSLEDQVLSMLSP